MLGFRRFGTMGARSLDRLGEQGGLSWSVDTNAWDRPLQTPLTGTFRESVGFDERSIAP